MHLIQYTNHALISLITFSTLVGLLYLAGPLYMLQIYDRVLMSASVPTLIGLSLLVLGLYAVMAIVDGCRNALLSIAASRFEAQLASQTLEAELQARRAGLSRSSVPALRHLRVLRQALCSPIPTALLDAPFSLVFVAFLFLLHPLYGSLAMVGGSLIFLVANLNRLLHKSTLLEARHQDRRYSDRAEEMLQRSETVEALGMRRSMMTEWQELFARSDALTLRASKGLSVLGSSSGCLRLALQSAMLGLGAWLSIRGESTPGAMIAASIIFGRAIAPLDRLVGHWLTLSNAMSSWRSLKAALSQDAPLPKKQTLARCGGEVTFRGVGAAAAGGNKLLLKNINLRIAPGECVGVTGPSGSGKSNFAKALLGLYPARLGTIRIDDVDVSALDDVFFGRHIGYLPQSIDLFSGTIAANISRFEPDARDDRIIAAARLANCHKLIKSLPNAFQTELIEMGKPLSAGQRQQIGLARAVFGAPKIIVLDEPNSSLDGAGTAALKATIKRLHHLRTTLIIISHQPGVLSLCSKLLVLNDGRQQAFGATDEVLAALKARNELVPASRTDGAVLNSG